MRTSDSIKEISAALAKAQAEMKPAAKDSNNPAFKSKYADLASVWEAARGPLTTNGIAVVQEAVTTEEGLSVTTRLCHASGEWIETGPITIPVTKHDAHGTASACSYGRRYGLSCAISSVADVQDDDGNAASAAPPARAAGTLSTGEFGKYKVAIGTANDEVALKRVYTEAYVAAQRVGDTDAMTRLTDLKDTRKQELLDAKAVA